MAILRGYYSELILKYYSKETYQLSNWKM